MVDSTSRPSDDPGREAELGTADERTTNESRDRDVVIVGGGPAGCAAGVFTGRYGLDTLVFDRGNASLQRCAYLENFLGFPGGIDIETFYDLIHDHVERAGCDVRDEMVESVERTADGGFSVTVQEGRTVTTDRVIAAARYDADYLRPLDEADEMFETYVRRGEERERFDPEYPDRDGRTAVDGLYVASPVAETEMQAISAAGHGARVARTLIGDVRRERGFPSEMAHYRDWMHHTKHGSDESARRERQRDRFEKRLPDDVDLDDESIRELREREVERSLDRHLSEDEIIRRTTRGHDRLLEHVDDDRILAAAQDIARARESTSTD